MELNKKWKIFIFILLTKTKKIITAKPGEYVNFIFEFDFLFHEADFRIMLYSDMHDTRNNSRIIIFQINTHIFSYVRVPLNMY